MGQRSAACTVFDLLAQDEVRLGIPPPHLCPSLRMVSVSLVAFTVSFGLHVLTQEMFQDLVGQDFQAELAKVLPSELNAKCVHRNDIRPFLFDRCILTQHLRV